MSERSASTRASVAGVTDGSSPQKSDEQGPSTLPLRHLALDLPIAVLGASNREFDESNAIKLFELLGDKALEKLEELDLRFFYNPLRSLEGRVPSVRVLRLHNISLERGPYAGEDRNVRSFSFSAFARSQVLARSTTASRHSTASSPSSPTSSGSSSTRRTRDLAGLASARCRSSAPSVIPNSSPSYTSCSRQRRLPSFDCVHSGRRSSCGGRGRRAGGSGSASGTSSMRCKARRVARCDNGRNAKGI